MLWWTCPAGWANRPAFPTGEHKCKRLCLSRSGHKGVIRSGMKMTDDRAGGEEMRVWSVAVIAERKWEVGGGGIKQGMRGQVKRGEVMAWAIITRYKNLAVTCAPFLCGAMLLCYTVSLPLSSLKMPSSVFIRLSTAANFCKLSTFFGTVLLLWHILLFSGHTVFRNNHVIMLVSIKRQR